MTVETAFFIKDLNEAYPRGRDLINEGDDHIRLVKSTIKNTFPGIDKALTFSADELNKLDSALTIGDADLTINANVTVATGKSVNLGGNAVKGVGNPVDPTDGVNLQYLRTTATWPIGSVYISVDARNPSVIFGFGTWSAFSQGRVIIGSGTGTDTNNESKSFTLNEKLGEYSHKITVSEMPSHKHTLTSIAVGMGGEHSHDVDLRVHDYAVVNGNQWTVPMGDIAGENSRFHNTIGARTKTSAGHTHSITGDVDNTGGTDRMNIVQPYVVCNIWVRTA